MSHPSASRTKPFLAVLSTGGLIALLMWMQGAFEHKVAPGLSEAVAAEAVPPSQTARVIRKEADEVYAWPGTVAAKQVAQVAPKLPGRILRRNRLLSLQSFAAQSAKASVLLCSLQPASLISLRKLLLLLEGLTRHRANVGLLAAGLKHARHLGLTDLLLSLRRR